MWSLPLYKPSLISHSLISTSSSAFASIVQSYILCYLERSMNRPGDWNCKSCQHLNFQRHDSCQRCGDSKNGDRDDFGTFGGRGGSPFGFSTTTGSDVRPGDWYCAAANCGAHNFASRSSCFKCGAFKDDLAGGGYNNSSSAFNLQAGGFGGGGGGGGRPGWNSGDWICNRFGCNEHNFASRMVCFKCCSPREMFF